MRRTTSQGLWPLVLAIAVALVLADFLAHPFIGSSAGDAPPPRPGLTLFLARSEAAGPAAEVLRLAAGDLGGPRRAAGVGELQGGSAAALEHFAGRRWGARRVLLALTATTLSDLARDRREPLLPEAARRAARAQGLLAGLVPVAVVATDPLRLLVRARSPLRSGDLAAELASWPGRTVFGIPADSWIEGRFAALVAGLAAPARVPYAAFPDRENALLALSADEAQVALVPATRRAPRGLRELRWPRGAAPRSWVALMAPAGTTGGRLRRLRREVGSMMSSHRWRSGIAALGMLPARRRTPAQTREFLRSEARRAGRLQTLAARLRSRGDTPLSR